MGLLADLIFVYSRIKTVKHGGGAWDASFLLEKALEYRLRDEMHVHSPTFQGQLIEKKLDRKV